MAHVNCFCPRADKAGVNSDFTWQWLTLVLGAPHACVCSAVALATWKCLTFLFWSVRLEFSKFVLQLNLEIPAGLTRKIGVSSCSSSLNFANKCQALVGDGVFRKFLVLVFAAEIVSVQLMLWHVCSACNYQIRVRVRIAEIISIYLV